MKLIGYLLLALFFALMVYATRFLPPLGDRDAPIHRTTSAAGTPVAGTYYIANAYRDAHTTNMVTVVLADYRSFDTLGETIVVFTAGIACALILRRRVR
ncbi:MAG TPA: hydrogen gas-evolving membrane-bound hydrogenase subunit E [Candidatus Synoicihabitans sp.]|nr:hydrogen gas-evolving membrane-bound hydrogenase subunit E [Candidatus Synoicihabitans sp.]